MKTLQEMLNYELDKAWPPHKIVTGVIGRKLRDLGDQPH